MKGVFFELYSEVFRSIRSSSSTSSSSSRSSSNSRSRSRSSRSIGIKIKLQKNFCDLAALRENKKPKSFLSHRVAFAKDFIEIYIGKAQVQDQVQIQVQVQDHPEVLGSRSNFKKTFAS